MVLGPLIYTYKWYNFGNLSVPGSPAHLTKAAPQFNVRGGWRLSLSSLSLADLATFNQTELCVSRDHLPTPTPSLLRQFTSCIRIVQSTRRQLQLGRQCLNHVAFRTDRCSPQSPSRISVCVCICVCACACIWRQRTQHNPARPLAIASESSLVPRLFSLAGSTDTATHLADIASQTDTVLASTVLTLPSPRGQGEHQHQHQHHRRRHHRPPTLDSPNT